MLTREPQYAAAFEEPSVILGPCTGATWRWDAKKLGIMLARYKFVAKMLADQNIVAEIGCGDGFGSAVVEQEVERVDLFDFDPVFAVDRIKQHDIVYGPLPLHYDAIYMLDVLEHIAPEEESIALRNVTRSLVPSGVFIAGMPSLESQVYASPPSRIGHVNCQSGERLKVSMQRFFNNVFLFGMNDEVLHTGFSPMCHYRLALCTGPRII